MRWLRYILSLGRLEGHETATPDIPVPHFTWILESKNREWELSGTDRQWSPSTKNRQWVLPDRN